jgi:hypothetical protein
MFRSVIQAQAATAARIGNFPVSGVLVRDTVAVVVSVFIRERCLVLNEDTRAVRALFW